MGTKIGRYQILKKLSPPSVFLAEDTTGAKKLLNQYELASDLVLNDFDTKILMSLKHRNLLAPSDIFIKGDFKYAVYDYSKTDNLQNYLKKKGKVTEKELSRILKEIIDAYEVIQRKGLVGPSTDPAHTLYCLFSTLRAPCAHTLQPPSRQRLFYSLALPHGLELYQCS